MQTEPPPPSKRSDRPFVGRSAERAAFDARIDDALRSDGSIVLLFGDPGIGKTSLLRSWLERSRARSFLVASVTNFPFAGDPYAPLAELCRSVARADPRALPRGENRPLFTRFLDLLPFTSAPDAEPWQKRRLFVLVREFLERAAASAPLVLAIDDTHWADPESLELLQYLAPFIADLRVVLVLALRRSDVGRSRQLTLWHRSSVSPHAIASSSARCRSRKHASSFLRWFQPGGGSHNARSTKSASGVRKVRSLLKNW